MQILISFSLSARRAGSLVSKHAVILFIYFLEFFFFIYLKLVKFDFDFVCYFWKSSFVLYFSGFFIGSRSVGHPRDMETHKDLFCGLCVCGERVHHHSATPRVASFSRQKNIREKIVPFFDSVGSPCPSTLVNSPLALSRTYIHTCMCMWYMRTLVSCSPQDGYCYSVRHIFWKVKGRLFSLSSLVGFSTVF